MAAPTLVGTGAGMDYSSNTSPRSTGSVTCQTGDILVAIGINEGGGGSAMTISSTPSLTWTQQQFYNNSGDCFISVWSAIAGSNAGHTVTFTNPAGAAFGGEFQAWRGSSGVGNSAKNQASGAPSVNLTCSANSAIMIGDGDWAAIAGASTGLTNAGTFTLMDDVVVSGTYGAHLGYHADCGSAGTYAVGFSAQGGQTYSIVAIEIKGSASVTDAFTCTVKDSIKMMGCGI
jgi:hypothetical protein